MKTADSTIFAYICARVGYFICTCNKKPGTRTCTQYLRVLVLVTSLIITIIYLFINMQHKMIMYNLANRICKAQQELLKQPLSYTITIVHEIKKTVIHKIHIHSAHKNIHTP